MYSLRMKTISSLLDKDDSVLDIGTDHALIPIYLIKNNLVKLAHGSDISNAVLKGAISNVENASLEDKIKLFLSDGVKSVDTTSYNTFIITGMGFTTIKNILDNASLENIDKLIIQSNNNLYDLRKYINHLGYKIADEICIKDKEISYNIIKFVKGNEELSETELNCGKFDTKNIWSYKENLSILENILTKVTDLNRKKELENLINYYKEYISKEKI